MDSSSGDTQQNIRGQLVWQLVGACVSFAVYLLIFVFFIKIVSYNKAGCHIPWKPMAWILLLFSGLFVLLMLALIIGLSVALGEYDSKTK